MSRKTPLLLPPTLEEILAVAKEIDLPEREAKKFFFFYDSKGWKVGKERMVSFKSALQGWKLTFEERGGGMINGKPVQRDWIERELKKL